jgi:plastocyanin
MMRRTLLAFLALATIVAVGCFNESSLDPSNSHGTSTGVGGGDGGGGGGTPDSAGAFDTASVAIFDNGFSPTTVAVSPGGTVTWTWTGANAHSVVFDDVRLSGSQVQSSGTFQQTFPNAGTFSYFCSVHGRAVMSGVVTVK